MKGHYYTNLVDCVLAIQGHVLIEDSEVNEVAFSSKWFSNVLDVILEIWMLFKVCEDVSRWPIQLLCNIHSEIRN